MAPTRSPYAFHTFTVCVLVPVASSGAEGCAAMQVRPLLGECASRARTSAPGPPPPLAGPPAPRMSHSLRLPPVQAVASCRPSPPSPMASPARRVPAGRTPLSPATGRVGQRRSSSCTLPSAQPAASSGSSRAAARRSTTPPTTRPPRPTAATSAQPVPGRAPQGSRPTAATHASRARSHSHRQRPPAPPAAASTLVGSLYSNTAPHEPP
mmetsp:Transcript_5101/g.12875  ORF Transcript_5101/g.12875 Transcript_5101/m.12875 type:complete len:210 (+) Transcript_5101:171-800(+)